MITPHCNTFCAGGNGERRMRLLINAILAALIVFPSVGMMPEMMPKRAQMFVTARNRRRLIAAGKYLELLV
jgi:hypothetical protein